MPIEGEESEAIEMLQHLRINVVLRIIRFVCSVWKL